MILLTLLSAGLFATWIYKAARKRTAFLLVGVFLIWQFGLKILSTLFLDIFGPIFAPDVGTMVGGKGSSTFLLVIFLWVPLLVIYWFLGPRRKTRAPPPEPNLERGGITFGDIAVWLMSTYVIILYLDMLRIGVIPFISGIDRFDYEGGVFHKFLFNFVWMIAFLVGYVIARTRIVTGAWDLRCATILGALFVYLFLTGHRFGAFYVTVSFVALAVASVYYAIDQKWPVALPTQQSRIQALARSPAVISIVALFAFSIVGLAIFNNLFVVRDYGDEAGEALTQRLFVQPVELYWLTWERWTEGAVIDGKEALYFMFNDPFDPTRNSGVQYLMMLYLGQDQAFHQFVEQGQDYAGGYPEILIELGGVTVAAVAAALVAVVVGFLYRLCVTMIARGHFLTPVMAIYFCYGMLGIYLGGMLNFLSVWTYWAKFAALIVAALIDWLFDRSGRRLFPWVLIPNRKNATAPVPLAQPSP